MAKVAVIAGTGLCDPKFLENMEKLSIETPYGKPSYLLKGKIDGREVILLVRHGKKHEYPPHRVNYRANIWALKELGVERVISVSAVGIINPKISPGDFVIVDQFIDFTKQRPFTFYDGSEVYHVDFTQPYCPEMRNTIIKKARELGISFHEKGVYVCTEGPRYETPAEIKMFKLLGADVVGMTNVPECVLARELCICYAAICVGTNYAAGMQSRLTSDEVVDMMERKGKELKILLREVLKNLPEERRCICKDALKNAKIEK